MLLRSSSTPILGSLLSSESPNNFDQGRPPSSDTHKKLSFHACQQTCHPFSWNPSPVSHSVSGFPECHRESNSSSKGFRRAQSDGNLEALAALEIDEFHRSNLAKPPKRHPAVLQTIPSFSLYGYRDEAEDDGGVEEDEVCGGHSLERSVTIGEHVPSSGTDFSFPDENLKGYFGSSDETGAQDILSIGRIGYSSLFLAARGHEYAIVDSGSAFNCGGSGGKGNFPPEGSEGEEDEFGLEYYYKRMVKENPSNALFLRNYAQFLHQTKQDFSGAEEYYSRAILAEPGDGEILSQYAKFIWEVHHDHDRAAIYFEQAVEAASHNSHVLAAYAYFLWETEEEEDDQSQCSATIG